MKRIVLLTFVALAYGQVAHAQVTTFSDRAAWSAAAGEFVQTEDLNSFVTDTSFQNTVIPLLNMAITQLNGPPANGNFPNFIDVFPFAEEGRRSIDNTTFIVGEVDDGGTRISIQFTQPVTGWGADFGSHDGDTVIDVFDPFGNLLGTTAGVEGDATFYGFHLAAGQTAGRIELKFIGTFNDLFGMDNLSFVEASGAPDPVALTASLITAVAGLDTINGGEATSLTQKLDAVVALASRGQTRAAINMLNAFVLQIDALVSSGSLTPSAGQALIADAAVIAALLS
jgi:hypothetical protein